MPLVSAHEILLNFLNGTHFYLHSPRLFIRYFYYFTFLCKMSLIPHGPMLSFSGVGEATGTLHTLELLKNILFVLPYNSLKSCCEIILRVMTLSNVVSTFLCGYDGNTCSDII